MDGLLLPLREGSDLGVERLRDLVGEEVADGGGERGSCVGDVTRCSDGLSEGCSAVIERAEMRFALDALGVAEPEGGRGVVGRQLGGLSVVVAGARAAAPALRDVV